MAARRHQPGHRPQEEGAAAHQRRGNQPALDQRRVAIEIGEDGLHQLGALDDAVGDPRPFLLLDQQRYRRERPGPFLAFADDPETGADILRMALHPFAGMAEIVAGNHRQLFEHRRPGRVVAARAEHVATLLPRAIIRDPARGMDRGIKQRGRGKRGHQVRNSPAGGHHNP